MDEQLAAMRGVGVLRKLAHWAAMLWIQIGITILLFCLISVMAGAIVKVVKHSRESGKPVETDAYPTEPWAAEYFKAMNRVHMRWYPYVYWKTAPMRSPFLNIDERSNRVTWEPRQRRHDGRPFFRIFAFGGSTTWGAGARDDRTIPSLLARHFAQKADYDVEVSNFGQMGWVTTQEVIYLYQLLSRGERPDLVIFYDGVNECFLGYQNGIAGLTQNEFIRAQEFGLLGSSAGRKRLYGAAIRAALMNTGLADLVKLLMGKDKGNVERQEIKPMSLIAYLAPPRDFEGRDAVEQDIVDIYLFNRQVVQTLGDRFKFRSLFYWQPVIYSKSPLTSLERHFVGARTRQDFFSGTYKRVAAVAQSNGIIDISGILNGQDRSYFIDPWHITEAGNEIVVQRMAGDAEPILARLARDRQAASAARAAAGDPGENHASPGPGVAR